MTTRVDVAIVHWDVALKLEDFLMKLLLELILLLSHLFSNQATPCNGVEILSRLYST